MPPPAPPGISLSLSRWVSILGLGRTTVAAPVSSLAVCHASAYSILGHVNGLDERDAVLSVPYGHLADSARSLCSSARAARDGTNFSAFRGGAYDNVQTVT